MRENRKEGKKEREIEKITEELKSLSDFTENHLKPEDYACPGGYAHKIANDIKEIKTAQLRKFFNEIKRLHQQTKPEKNIEKVKVETVKLMPELVFAKGRKVITSEFYNLLEICLLKDDNGKKKCRFQSYDEFENFVSFLEAVVAYQKGNIPISREEKAEEDK